MRFAVTAVAALLVLALPCVAPAQSAGKLYQWKDANGVTHYSQTPPAAGNYQTRNVANPVAPPVPAATQSSDAGESEACKRARANLALLRSEQPVHLEGNEDTPLTADQRKAQIDLAEASIRANCNAAR